MVIHKAFSTLIFDYLYFKKRDDLLLCETYLTHDISFKTHNPKVRLLSTHYPSCYSSSPRVGFASGTFFSFFPSLHKYHRKAAAATAHPKATPRPIVAFLSALQSSTFNGETLEVSVEAQLVAEGVTETKLVLRMTNVAVEVPVPAAKDSIAAPAGMRTVPAPVEQQLRAAWSCPQQNDVYVSQGVNTTSADWKLSSLNMAI